MAPASTPSARRTGEPGEFVGSQKRFSQTVADRGFERGQDSRTRQAIFRGIALRADHA